MDRIDLLESKVKEMIGVVQVLRNENRDLKEQLAQAREEIRSVGDERQVLDQERTVVRGRIEQLLGDLEELKQEAEASDSQIQTRFHPVDENAGNHPGEMAQAPNNPVIPGFA